jgi:tetratricopeptide (TPR) repeat protein
MKTNKNKASFFKIWRFFARGKRKTSSSLQPFLDLAGRNPMDGNPHLKIAEIYQRQGEKQKALREYLRAAELFCDTGHYHKGVAIYKKLLKEGLEMKLVKIKLTDTYEKMELIEQTLTQHHKISCSHGTMGLTDNGLEIQDSMGEPDPQKNNLDDVFNLNAEADAQNPIGENTLVHSPETEISCFFDLAKKLEANSLLELEDNKSITIEESYRSENVFEELQKTRDIEKLYPNHNYQLGVACKEMGLIDEAISHFQLALEKGQKPLEVNNLLSQCLIDNGHRKKSKSFKGTLQEESALA